MLGSSTPHLVAAAANAGAVGFEGCGQLPNHEVEGKIRAAQALLHEGAVFGVNLFVPSGCYVSPATWTSTQTAAVKTAANRHDVYLQELNGGAASAATSSSLDELQQTFDGQVDAIIGGGVKLASFHFGWPTAANVERLRGAGVTLIGCATTVAEARNLAELGADAIIAQSSDAGGHRGMFLDAENYRRELVGTLPLVRSIVKAVEVPIIAAGGIMDGRDVAELLSVGASAVQMGTAFLSCPECNTTDFHREALLNFGAPGRSAENPLPTVITQGFTGKAAQGLQTDRAIKMADIEAQLPHCFNGMPAGRTVQAAAVKAGCRDSAYMWAGTGYTRSRALPAAELVETLVAEVAAASA